MFLRYSITQEGVRLGQRLDEIEGENPSNKPLEIKAINMDRTCEQQPASSAPPLQPNSIQSSPPCQQPVDSFPSQLNLTDNLPAKHRHIMTSEPRVSSCGGITSSE